MSNEDFNPDTFDWGTGAPGINVDDVAPDIDEMVIKAALDAQEEAFGWRYVKRSEVKEGAGRLYRVPYYMPKEHREWFEEQFPGYTFVWDGARAHHDHPRSHLATELGEMSMVEDAIRNGETWIDLFGNGARNRKYKRKCINLYTLATPKDHIRYQNRGTTDVPYDLEKLCDPKSVLGKINLVTCTHAGYYLSMDDISRIVNTSAQRRLRFLIHRHKDTHGMLNAGEIEYWVDENANVKQQNVDTGEGYSHPSMEALFHQGSAKAAAGGVAWTIKAGGGDAYQVDFVGCPNEICEVFVPLKFLKPETWEEYVFAGVSVKRFLHWTWIQATTQQGRIAIEDTDLLTKLRRYVAGKQRTPRLKTELMNHARRLCNKADIISIHGGGAHDIPVASIHDYVEVAFYVDVRKELDASISFHRDNCKMVDALNQYYEKGALPKDFTVLTSATAYSARTFSEAAIRVINLIRETQDITVQEYLENNLPGEDLAKLKIDYGIADRIPAPWGIGW